MMSTTPSPTHALSTSHPSPLPGPRIALDLLGAARTRLKAPTTVHDSSAPQLSGFMEAAGDTKVYQDGVLDVNIESWYPLIREHTFATEFHPISLDDGQLFIDSYLAYEQHQKGAAVRGAAGPAAAYSPPPELAARVARLAAGLDRCIDSVRGGSAADTGRGVFIKASSRSAKDAPTSQSRLGEVYRGKLAAQPDRGDNAKLVAMLEAGLELLKARTAADALELFMHSERIYQDMLLATDRPDRWEESFVVREWVDIDVGMEFRGFVKGGRLTALSQYNHLAYFPGLVARKAEIGAMIDRFFTDDILPKLSPKFTDYVIDFALTEPAAGAALAKDGGGGGGREGQGGAAPKLWVIELNPFLETTDGCLFSWGRERDTLEGRAASDGCAVGAAAEGGDSAAAAAAAVDAAGGLPFEFRICTAPRLGGASLIAKDWRALLDSVPDAASGGEQAGGQSWTPGGYRGDWKWDES